MLRTLKLKHVIIIDIILFIVLYILLSTRVFADTAYNPVGYYMGRVVREAEASHADARDNAVGDAIDSVTVYLGQGYNGTVHQNNRVFATFDIPDFGADSLVSAKLYFDGAADLSATNFNLYVIVSTQSGELATSDYNDFDGWQASGAYNGSILNNTWNTSSYSANWNYVTFSDTGIDSINIYENSSITLSLLSSRDYGDTTQTQNEIIGITQDTIYLNLITTPTTSSGVLRSSVLYSTTPQVLYDKTRIPLWKP
jgi:hypothetical protein